MSATAAPNYPQRIQRKRTRGSRLTGGALSVARPSRYGNPFRIVGTSVVGMDWDDALEWDCGIGAMPDACQTYRRLPTRDAAAQYAVDLYRELLHARQRDWDPSRFAKWISGAQGRDLACYCPLDQPCHADVLLDIANREALQADPALLFRLDPDSACR
jgi:hypothetical protein